MKKIISILLIALVYKTPASACMMLEPFKESDKLKAKTVFYGRAIDYKIIKENESAKVTFNVLKNIKGKKQKKWTVLIESNTNTSIPKNL